MEPTAITTPLNPEYCEVCNTPTTIEDAFCTKCGYPLKGTEIEQGNFKAQMTVNHIDMAEYHAKIKTAQVRLYFVAALWVIISLVDWSKLSGSEDRTTVLLIDLLIAAIFAGLGVWCNKKPFAALVSGISLYVIIQVLIVISNPMMIFSGIIAKVIIILSFVTGIKAALEAEKLKKEAHIV